VPGQKLVATSQLTFDGVGPIKLGMTLQEASAASGLPIVMATPDTCNPEHVAHVAGDPFSDFARGEDLSFGVDNSRIVKVRASRPSFATDKGIHRGSTEAEVLASYSSATVGQNIYGTTFVTVTDSQGRVLAFYEGDGGGVVIIQLGTSSGTLDVGSC
jgi:hypothetical protein